MLISGKQAFVGGVKYDSPKNDCVGGYIWTDREMLLEDYSARSKIH